MHVNDLTIEHQTALTIMENNADITITINDEVVDLNGYCLAWCKECTDGINDTRDECDLWVRSHAKKYHAWNA